MVFSRSVLWPFTRLQPHFLFFSGGIGVSPWGHLIKKVWVPSGTSEKASKRMWTGKLIEG